MWVDRERMCEEVCERMCGEKACCRERVCGRECGRKWVMD